MKVTSIASLVLIPALLTGCAAPSNDGNSKNTSEILTKNLPSEVTAFGVVLAAVLLTSGDIEKALSEGLVTPEVVVEARMAIANKQVDLWRQRAEMDK